MKNNILRTLSITLASIMLASALASCNPNTGGDTTESESLGKTESSSSVSSSETESSKSEDTSSESEKESSSESSSSSESESTGSPSESETEKDSEYDDETYNSLISGENAPLIELADSLKNGVNAYFTDPTRSKYHFENKKVGVTYDLNGSKLVDSITNKAGGVYVSNTMDVFLRLTDGTTYYASKSDKTPIANIFRMGYYYYENRIEGLSFNDGYVFANKEGKKINCGKANILRYNMTEYVGLDSEGGVTIRVTDNLDPYITYKTVNFSASDYNILALTMKADQNFSSSLSVYLVAGSETGSNTAFSNNQSIGFDIIPDGEYHTYYIPIYQINGYAGQVTGLRLDFMTMQGAIDATFAISDLRVLKADLNATPTQEVYLNRMFNTYSDKLHQTLQITTLRDVSDVQAIGMITEISESRVNGVVIKDRNGLHYDTLKGIAWNTVEYVGFDIKGAGIYGYIMPYDGSGGTIRVTLEDGVYKIEQTRTPDGFELIESPAGSNNGNDFYMGHRIYTDQFHNFDRFIVEAELERNPLTEENFIINTDASTYGAFLGYDALRGCYTLAIDGSGGFGPPYKLHQNRQYNVTFTLKGDGVNNRSIYVLARYDEGGALECAALLDGKQMLLPVPLEVGKNFSEGGDSPIFYADDKYYSETILPMIAGADTESTYSIVNLYYNWGKYPLKQISFIQYYSPYYHLSTGVHESNCIIPYYFCQWGETLNMLPDHRPMSGPFWEGDPQHTYCGVHSFLQYTDADGNYSATENILDTIGSYGPIYADVTMDFISDDGKIKVTYNHMEFPQTDENRAYYEMKYEVLEDISFADFGHDFSFYSVRSLDPKGLYTKVGYLNTDNECTYTTAAGRGESFEYVLGSICPYFSFFDMENCGDKTRGYNNLSFMIYDAEFTIGGKEATPSFLLVNSFAELSLSLDLDAVELKAGDTFTIYAIIMPWQSYEVYDENEPDINVRRVRENTLLNPLTVTAGENAEKIESVFLPKIKTTNGKSATFTLSGGENNVAVRIYGFEKLTAPVIEELIDGEWKIVDLSSISTPDPFGYGYQYDGYGVYYDGDGTYSYAFITTMTAGAPRTFRVTAAEDFEGWPEIIKEPDPMNLWLDAQKLNGPFATAASRFGGVSLLSEDGVNFLRIKRNGTDKEATVTLFDDPEGMLAGRYLAFKVRLPQGQASKLFTWEFYTATENNMYDDAGNILIVGQDYRASGANLADGNWHVIVIDLEDYGKDSFKKSDDGNYYLKYLRFDVFNVGNATDCIVDIAYIGFHDSFEEILEYNDSLPTVAYFKTASYFEHVSTKNNEALNLHIDAGELDAIIHRYKDRFHSVTLSDDRSYITLAGSTGAEAIIELFKGNKTATGQYLVLKYRIPKATTAPFGYWQFYLNTDGGAADNAANGYTAEGYGTAIISDGEWQVLIFDISAWNKSTYAQNANGEYVANYLRFDFFNSALGADVSYDVAYIAFSDSLADIYAYESDMDFVTLATGSKSLAKIDPATGKELTGENDGSETETVEETSEEITENVPEETTKDITEDETEGGYSFIMDAAALDKHMGANKSKFHSVTLSNGGDYITLAGSVGSEATIEIFKNSAKEAGRYLVLKYRIPKADRAPFGYWQFYLNTNGEAAGSSNVYNCENADMVVANGEWQVLVVDLAARNLASYQPNSDGKYIAQFFRFDFFNSQLGADVSYDVAYLAFSDSLDAIWEYESDMAYLTLCTAQKVSEKIYPALDEDESSSTEESFEETAEDTIEETTEETTEEATEEVVETDFPFMMDAEALNKHLQSSASRFHSVTLSEDKDYVNLAGCTGSEAAIEIVKGSIRETGRYLVIKYRIPKADRAPFGYWQFYLNTTGEAAGSSCVYNCENADMVVANGEWQVLVVDLAARGLDSYQQSSDGRYIAKLFRFDFFNSQFSADVSYDVAYIAFANTLEFICEYESDMDHITLCTAQKVSQKIDPATVTEIAK